MVPSTRIVRDGLQMRCQSPHSLQEIQPPVMGLKVLAMTDTSFKEHGLIRLVALQEKE